MHEEFAFTVSAEVFRDARGIVRHVSHRQKPVGTNVGKPRDSAEVYLKSRNDLFGISADALTALELEPEAAPREVESQLRFLGEKTFFDLTTVAYQQTVLCLPVWGAGFAVHVKDSPQRVIAATSSVHFDVVVDLPRADVLDRLRMMGERNLAVPLGIPLPPAARGAAMKILRTRLVVFRYRAAERLRPDPGPDAADPSQQPRHKHPSLPLPPIHPAIEDGRHYVAAEIIFTLATPTGRTLNWIAIIEADTHAVLYARAFTDFADGYVFLADPITKTGNATMTTKAPGSDLAAARSLMPLLNLSSPTGGDQSLTGKFVHLADLESPGAAPPTELVGVIFDYAVKTDYFAAVNAYYHTDRFFRLVEDLGFPVNNYFNGTTFPLSVDHRGHYSLPAGTEVNASCSGTGLGGIASCDFALAVITLDRNLKSINPLGIACDWRVVLHELAGHGTLYEHVGDSHLGFAHSVGDSFAAILSDPDSLAPAAVRDRTFPWIEAFADRSHKRQIADGWAWGGTEDKLSYFGYFTEQILSTCNFRIYESLGGASPDMDTRHFAARYMTYLLLQAIATLTPVTNPNTAFEFVAALITADQADWTTATQIHRGGAFSKVIRWGYEKQGLYQLPGVPTWVTKPGSPPDVDVYIDDGRHGEYDYQDDYQSCPSIWNRLANDAIQAHQQPVMGQTNFAFVKIKNRGHLPATSVIVRGFHRRPGTNRIWPNDWQAMSTASLVAPDVAANNAAEIVLGPFRWTPTQLGDDSMLMIVSASGDVSNADKFSAVASIPDWRLVPHDNNIGLRDVSPV